MKSVTAAEELDKVRASAGACVDRNLKAALETAVEGKISGLSPIPGSG